MFKVRTKYFIYTIIILVTLCIIVIEQGYKSTSGVLQNEIFQKLTILKKSRIKELDDYFNKLSAIAKTVSANDVLLTYVSLIDINSRTDTLGYENIGTSLKSKVAQLKIEHSFQALYLIDQSGKLVFSSTKKSKTFQNKEGVLQCSSDSTKEMDRDLDVIFIEAFDPILELYSVVVGTPLIIDGNNLGCAFLQYSINDINDIMTSYNAVSLWADDYGVETYVVGKDQVLRTDSRFEYTADSMLVASKNQQWKGMKIETLALERGFKNIEGQSELLDYRGVVVLSSYQQFNHDQLSWLVISKVDKNKLFIGLVQLEQQLLSIVLIFAALVIGLISFPGDKLTAYIDTFWKRLG